MLVENNEIVHKEEIIANIMNTFQNHKSIKRIMLADFSSKSSLKPNSLSEPDVKKEILNSSSKKANRKYDIPAKMLKNTNSVHLSKLKLLINSCLKKGIFLDDLKLADITPKLKRKIV